jgi:hypothetical protein
MTTTLTAPTRAVAPLPADGFINGEQLKARMDLILDVAKHVMTENVDFGKIPGTDKPSLWKPGAEKLCVAFRVAAGEPTVEDLSTSDEIRYRVQVPGINQINGTLLGVGIGECSTGEKKYKWRYPVHQKEYDATPADKRRMVFKRDGSTYPQVRTEPADLANTVLKMAHKRALVAMALVVTGASAIFSQDIEDLPEEIRDSVAQEERQPERKAPQRASATGNAAKPKPAAGDHKVSDPCTIVKVTEKPREGQDPVYWIETSDGQRYSTFSKSDADELKSFAGTDHPVRLTYVEKQSGGKTYRNFVSVEIVEPAPAAASSQPSGPAPEVTEAELDWGGSKS